MKIESSDSIEQASSSRSLFTVSGMIAKNPGSHHNALLDLLWKGGQRRFGQTEGTRFTQRLSVSMEARSKHGFRGRHLVEDGSEPRSSARSVLEHGSTECVGCRRRRAFTSSLHLVPRVGETRRFLI